MTDRAESVLAAVTTALTGLTTTGSNVVRGRSRPITTLPALAIDMGSEAPVGDPNVAYQDVYLDIDVTMFVKETGVVDTKLNTINAEVYAAIMGTPQLGLGYVEDTIWVGRGAPARSGELEKKVAFQTITFRVYYRHSYASTES